MFGIINKIYIINKLNTITYVWENKYKITIVLFILTFVEEQSTRETDLKKKMSVRQNANSCILKIR